MRTPLAPLVAVALAVASSAAVATPTRNCDHAARAEALAQANRARTAALANDNIIGLGGILAIGVIGSGLVATMSADNREDATVGVALAGSGVLGSGIVLLAAVWSAGNTSEKEAALANEVDIIGTCSAAVATPGPAATTVALAP